MSEPDICVVCHDALGMEKIKLATCECNIYYCQKCREDLNKRKFGCVVCGKKPMMNANDYYRRFESSESDDGQELSSINSDDMEMLRRNLFNSGSDSDDDTDSDPIGTVYYPSLSSSDSDSIDTEYNSSSSTSTSDSDSIDTEYYSSSSTSTSDSDGITFYIKKSYSSTSDSYDI